MPSRSRSRIVGPDQKPTDENGRNTVNEIVPRIVKSPVFGVALSRSVFDRNHRDTRVQSVASALAIAAANSLTPISSETTVFLPL